jgi:hypothetical protein
VQKALLGVLHTLALVVLDERVDLDERAVLLEEEIVELGDQLNGLLLDLGTLEAEFVGDLLELLRCETLLDINRDLEDGVGVLGRQRLDVATTFSLHTHAHTTSSNKQQKQKQHKGMK